MPDPARACVATAPMSADSIRRADRPGLVGSYTLIVADTATDTRRVRRTLAGRLTLAATDLSVRYRWMERAIGRRWGERPLRGTFSWFDSTAAGGVRGPFPTEMIEHQIRLGPVDFVTGGAFTDWSGIELEPLWRTRQGFGGRWTESVGIESAREGAGYFCAMADAPMPSAT
jgi:hypothetical protein